MPEALDGTWTILGVEVDRIQVVVLVTVIVAVTGLSLFVSKTTTGKSMRAVAADSEIASLMGIRVDRVIDDVRDRGLLAGIAAVLFSITFESVSFTMGFRPGIAAFTAAVLGGIGSISAPRSAASCSGAPAVARPGADPHRLRHPVLVPAEGRLHVPGPGPGPDLPPGRPPRIGRGGEGDGRDPDALDRPRRSARGRGAIYVALVGLYTKFADLELGGEQITLGRC